MRSPESGAFVAAAIAVIAVAALIRADRPLAVALATLWRLGATVAVFVHYEAVGLVRWLRGERNLGPELVRRAFEDLGPTYLKLGQLIASSHGLFPEAYCREFGKTLDRVKPFAYADVERTLIAELGSSGDPARHGHAEDAAGCVARPLEHAFARFDTQPLASASIAQVHAATLVDGNDVVVKIQRPHIATRIAADMRILKVAANVLSLVPTVELANPVGIIEDFERTLAEELDFRREAANMDEFNRMMAELGHADVRAPRIIHALTTARVITMERFYGVRVDDVPAISARNVDSEAKLVHGLRCWFQCMILYGFFHGDVHAGNLMLLDDDSLGFLDFGIIGRFDKKTRTQIAEYLVAFVSSDFQALSRVMMSMDAVSAGVDLDAMARDLAKAYAPILTTQFGDLNYASVLPDILRTSVKHRMRLPREFVLVTKQMLYFDRYAKLLAPKLNIFSDPRLVAAIAQDVMRARAAAV
jgi:predicted unusual protein kinase regulating ubiquinone biosynthesis (AarF/ABC1/UbiB family)